MRPHHIGKVQDHLALGRFASGAMASVTRRVKPKASSMARQLATSPMKRCRHVVDGAVGI